MVGDISDSTLQEKQDAFSYVIGASSLIVFITGLIVYNFLNIEIDSEAKIGDFSDMKKTTNLLYKNGYASSPEDDHWSRLGHTTVLDHYILNDRLKECLE